MALREESGAREYSLVYARAERSIWDSMPEDDDGEPARVKVTTLTKPFDRRRAQRVYDLWERMLKGVRYPDGGPGAGLLDDGEMIEFRYTRKGMYGETCSPEKGAPRLLTDIGDILITCCKSQGDELRKSLKALDAKCTELETYLNAKAEAGRTK
jgi:hypothetical protein